MTTYTAINNSEVDTDSPITESLMTRLRDNPIAMASGATGAPKIQDAAFAAASINANKLVSSSVDALQLAANCVHTSELYAVSAEFSTTSTTYTIAMTGGLYVFHTQNKCAVASAGFTYGGYSTVNSSNVVASGTTYGTRMTIGSSSGNTTSCQYNYVGSSPPHDMGDGDIPMFLFAVINKTTGDIISISSAIDPVWQASGPTDAMPTIRNERGLFKIAKEIPEGLEALSPAERAATIADLPYVQIEITEAIKHADKDIIPHPFMGNDFSDSAVVMLDPVSDTVRDLSVLCEAGEDIHEIMRGGYINIGNTALSRVTPAGLLIPATSWKKTT